MKKSTLIVTLLAALYGTTTSTQAQANDINWNYLSAGYKSMSIDDDESFDTDLSGFEFEGSLTLTNNVFVMAELESLSDEITFMNTDIDVDMTQTRLGLGYAHAFSAQSSVFGAVGYANIDTEAKAGSFKEGEDFGGYFIRGGLRSKLTNEVELFGYATYSNYDIDEEINDGDDDETTITVGGRYYVQPNLTLNASYQIVDDGGAFVLGASYQF